MTNTERNIRTLVVSFVIALGVLIPLRIVELNNNYSVRNTMVLGEETYNDEKYYVVEEEIEETEMVLDGEGYDEENYEEDYVVEEEIILPEAQ